MPPPHLSETKSSSQPLSQNKASNTSMDSIILNTSDPPDYNIIVGTGDKQQIFKVHKCVICANSEYFKGICNSKAFKENQKNASEFPDFEPEVMAIILEYLYAVAENGTILSLSDGSYDLLEVVEIFKYADYLMISELRKMAINAFTTDFNFDVKSWRGCEVANQAIVALSKMVGGDGKEMDPMIHSLLCNMCQNCWNKTRLRMKNIRKIISEDSGAMADLLEKSFVF